MMADEILKKEVIMIKRVKLSRAKCCRFCFITLMAVIVFGTACSNDPADNGVDPHLGNKTLIVTNEQVWEHTDSNKPSEMYTRSTVNSGIHIILGSNGESIGSGEIRNGILNFSVAEPRSENLAGWNYLSKLFPEWEDLAIDDPNTMGNIITPVFSTGTHRLLREKMANTNTTFGLEEILHVYTDRNCRITGNHGEGMIPGERYYITGNILDLSLKEGWNLLCRKEVYGLDGRDTVTMEIKNLVDFKWTIW